MVSTFLEHSRVFYRSDAWRKLRADCKRLAGYTCKSCGWVAPKGQRDKLHAHHVVPRPNLPFVTALDVQGNLKCLCEDCHDDAHPTHRIRTAGGAKKTTLFRAKRARFR